MPEKPFAPACERNRGPILQQLRPLLQSCRAGLDPALPIEVLEVGSGTGQHAVYFTHEMSALNIRWQPTEIPAHIQGIKQWQAEEPNENCLPPKSLDLSSAQWKESQFEALFTANTLHIVDWELVEKLFSGAAKTLKPGGLLLIYGPFNYGGNYSSESNRNFDKWLLARDPSSAIRDFEAVETLASRQVPALVLQQDIAMPANNRLLVFRKGE